MNTTRILGRLMAMSSDEVMGMVSPRTIADIKREDPTPKILAFVIGQEGAVGSRQTDYGAAHFSYGDIINFPTISNVGIIAG